MPYRVGCEANCGLWPTQTNKNGGILRIVIGYIGDFRLDGKGSRALIEADPNHQRVRLDRFVNGFVHGCVLGMENQVLSSWKSIAGELALR